MTDDLDKRINNSVASQVASAVAPLATLLYEVEKNAKAGSEKVLAEFVVHNKIDEIASKEIKGEIAKVNEIHDRDFAGIETFHTDTGARLKKLEIAIYGDDDDDNDLGMKKQNDEMYKILTTSKVVTGILGNTKVIALWIIAVGGAFVLIKQYLASFHPK